MFDNSKRLGSLVLSAFLFLALANPGKAAFRCEQVALQQQNCPDCYSSAPIDPILSGLPDARPISKNQIPEGISTSVVNGQLSESSIDIPPFQPASSVAPLTIDIDPHERHQRMWGYGAAMTDSCVANLERLSPEIRQRLMLKIFDRQRGAGFNYIRVPIGANDFALSEYSLDDTPDNQPDPEFKHFDFAREEKTIRLLREAKRINPELQFMATAWSAPAWMKSTRRLDGGVLLPQYYQAYANYLVRALEDFERAGIPIETFSVLNEPLITPAAKGWGFPQMYIGADEMRKFLKNYMIPTLEKERSAGRLRSKLLLHDHNFDNAWYVSSFLADPTIAQASAGVAFHCYGGRPSNMFSTMGADPKVPLFDTECSGVLKGPNGDKYFQWWLENQSLDDTRGGVVGAIGWNLCLDNHGGPENRGGCPGCRGMVTIAQDRSVSFNSEFIAMAQVSRFVRRGAVRIGSTDLSQQGVGNSAFQNPDGSLVIILRNEKPTAVTLTLRNDDCETTEVTLPAKGAVSLIWNQKRD